MHEATHAILDLQKAAFPRWEHELIAYLAEALCKISGGFSDFPIDISKRAAALARHIIADKAGRTFIDWTTMSIPPPSRTSRVKSSKPTRRYGARSFGVMGSDAPAARRAAVLQDDM